MTRSISTTTSSFVQGESTKCKKNSYELKELTDSHTSRRIPVNWCIVDRYVACLADLLKGLACPNSRYNIQAMCTTPFFSSNDAGELHVISLRREEKYIGEASTYS
jgi:hypothetical protein